MSNADDQAAALIESFVAGLHALAGDGKAIPDAWRARLRRALATPKGRTGRPPKDESLTIARELMVNRLNRAANRPPFLPDETKIKRLAEAHGKTKAQIERIDEKQGAAVLAGHMVELLEERLGFDDVKAVHELKKWATKYLAETPARKG